MSDGNPETRRLLHGWLDDTLQPDEVTRFLRLLAESPDLANDLAAASLTENALETYFAGASNFTRWDQLLADECRRVARQRNRRRITFAAIAAAALVTLGMYFIRHSENEIRETVSSSSPRLTKTRRFVLPAIPQTRPQSIAAAPQPEVPLTLEPDLMQLAEDFILPEMHLSGTIDDVLAQITEAVATHNYLHRTALTNLHIERNGTANGAAVSLGIRGYSILETLRLVATQTGLELETGHDSLTLRDRRDPLIPQAMSAVELESILTLRPETVEDPVDQRLASMGFAQPPKLLDQSSMENSWTPSEEDQTLYAAYKEILQRRASAVGYRSFTVETTVPPAPIPDKILDLDDEKKAKLPVATIVAHSELPDVWRAEVIPDVVISSETGPPITVAATSLGEVLVATGYVASNSNFSSTSDSLAGDGLSGFTPFTAIIPFGDQAVINTSLSDRSVLIITPVIIPFQP